MRMAHGDGQRIRGIRGDADLQAEQRADHVRHLQLFGGAETHHRELDGARRVFEHRHGLGHGAERRAARMSELQRAVDVAIDEDALDGDLIGLMLFDQLPHAFENACAGVR